MYELLDIQPGMLSAQSLQPDQGFPTKPYVKRTIENQDAKELLIKRLMNPSILANLGLHLSFHVHTDAEQQGLGAVLYQHHEGILIS